MPKPAWTRSVFVLGLLLCWLTAGWASAYDLKDNAILHAHRGQLLMEQAQYGPAIEEFKAAIRLNPYTPLSAALYNNLGLAYRKLGDYPMAFASFQHAARIQPTYALYYKNLIETYAEAGQLSETETALLAIVKENPEAAEAWFMLGLLYQERQNQKAAQACFRQFLKLQPESELARAAQAAL